MRKYKPTVKYNSNLGMYVIFVGRIITRYSFYDRNDAILWALNYHNNWNRQYEFYNERANTKIIL